MRDNDNLFKPTLLFDAMLLNGDVNIGDHSHETPHPGDDGDLEESDGNSVNANIAGGN